MTRVGFGGSCHWCTEAIFQSLRGVREVLQGWIATYGDDFSEAVIVEFDEMEISLEVLVAVHLATHSCTAEHSMRGKYRSAVYIFDEPEADAVHEAISDLQSCYKAPIITQVLPIQEFKLNQPEYLNYYYRDPQKPFCENIVRPKLQILLERFRNSVDEERLRL